MPRVPSYDSRVSQTTTPVVRNNTDVPIEAFGGGQGLQSVTRAAGNLAGVVGEIALKEKEKADDAAVTDGVTALVNRSLYLQNQMVKRQGKDAIGVTEESLKEFDKSAAEVEKNLYNGTQRTFFKKAYAREREQFNGILNKHEFVQSQKYMTESALSFIESSQNKVAQNFSDPFLVSEEIKKQQGKVAALGMQQGWGEDQINAETQKIHSANHSNVVQQFLTNDQYPMAQKWFDSIKGELQPKDIERLQGRISDGKATFYGVSTWNKMKDARLADGFPDETKMVSEINKLGNLTTEEKSKATQLIRAMAGNERTDITQRRMATDRQFMNDVLKVKQSGGTVQDAFKVADKYGFDDYEKHVKKVAAAKMFAPGEDGPSEPGLPLKMWEKVQSGNATREELDALLVSGRLNEKDHTSLRKDYYNQIVEGKNPKMNSAIEEIKLMADMKFGRTPSDRKDRFLYEALSERHNAKPEELIKKATDGLKEIVVKPGMLWDTKAPKWEVNFNERIYRRKIEGELGAEAVDGIVAGLKKYNNVESFSAKALDAFAAQFGGPDKIRPGTPVHNAIMALVKNGKDVTKQYVDQILKDFPNGIPTWK